MSSGMKRRTGPTIKDTICMKKHKIGDEVRGSRANSKYHMIPGVLVEAYVTLNGGFRNPAYVIEYPDGNKRSFQNIR